MLSEAELIRIKKRAEHILSIGRRHGQESIIYHVLRGDALDVLSLLDEITEIKTQYAKLRRADFKLITPDEVKVLLRQNQSEGSKDDN